MCNSVNLIHEPRPPYSTDGEAVNMQSCDSHYLPIALIKTGLIQHEAADHSSLGLGVW